MRFGLNHPDNVIRHFTSNKSFNGLWPGQIKSWIKINSGLNIPGKILLRHGSWKDGASVWSRQIPRLFWKDKKHIYSLKVQTSSGIRTKGIAIASSSGISKKTKADVSKLRYGFLMEPVDVIKCSSDNHIGLSQGAKVFGKIFFATRIFSKVYRNVKNSGI